MGMSKIKTTYCTYEYIIAIRQKIFFLAGLIAVLFLLH